jgi:hypothetical protein
LKGQSIFLKKVNILKRYYFDKTKINSSWVNYWALIGSEQVDWIIKSIQFFY